MRETLNILLVILSIFLMIIIVVPIYADSLLPPTNFKATNSGNNIILTWLNNPSATATVIIRGDGRYPQSITDGVQVYNGALQTYTDTNMASETAQHYYSAWSFDSNSGLYSISYATTVAGGIIVYIAVFAGVFLVAMGLGFAFKRPWMLMIALVFLIGTSVMLWLNNPITNLQSWVWLLLIPLGGIPVLFDVVSILGSNRVNTTAQTIKEDKEDDWNWSSDEKTTKRVRKTKLI